MQWRMDSKKIHQPPGPGLNPSFLYANHIVGKTGHQPPCLYQAVLEPRAPLQMNFDMMPYPSCSESWRYGTFEESSPIHPRTYGF
jgi:hypothetical protein